MLRSSLIPLLCLGFVTAGEERVSTDAQGRIVITPAQATPEILANPWPKAWEDLFLTRRSAFIKQYKGKSGVKIRSVPEACARTDFGRGWCVGWRRFQERLGWTEPFGGRPGP